MSTVTDLVTWAGRCATGSVYPPIPLRSARAVAVVGCMDAWRRNCQPVTLNLLTNHITYLVGPEFDLPAVPGVDLRPTDA